MANGNLTPEWTADELSQLAAQAATLVERQEELAAPGAAQSPLCPQAEERRQRWRQTAAKGNDALFNLRLTWDNLDAVRLCSEQRPARYEALPGWVNTLQRITARPSSAANFANLLDPQRPLPFETLLLPAISEARRRLVARAGPAYEKLTAVAHTTLERRLLERLSKLCAETLHLKFIIFRHKRRSLLTWLSGVQGEGSTEQYDAFVQEMEQGGLKRFWQEYPVLARLTAVAIDFWVEAQAEFMQRLAADWQAIQDQFAPGQTGLSQVVGVQAALGDSHHRGRSVVALTFASGLKIVYKPRPQCDNGCRGLIRRRVCLTSRCATLFYAPVFCRAGISPPAITATI